ncbi:flagellar biosynthesis protein FlaG [Parashewanella spongiae]|uniref:Flagellar biosynthesis protein FlaG n=1 Tax=Parashewanella spongiae TaxID=342950 RepID=A0A3A6U2A1_9GAMM|nr:flagellar protein FlaG [Parashewanella spongiae]MCL1076622.1 flagellar protein FlaG [Parashewanella spongiae]RJY19576.1 flagellar biosynthesis protein FlaG [Parashewanella spongiae]
MDINTYTAGTDVASASNQSNVVPNNQSGSGQSNAVSGNLSQQAPIDVLLNESNGVAELQKIFESAKEADVDALTAAAEELTEMMSVSRKSIQFQVHEESGKTVVSVMDTESGEIIRQIPSEEAIELAERFAEMSGLLLKTEV